jgi:hypothetical protein
MKFESPAGDNAPRRPFADSWPLTGARHTLAARRNGLSQVPPFMVLPGTRYTRIECGPKMSGMPFEQACEMIISATSCDHKRALDGFILSPQKLIATTGLAPTTVRRKSQRRCANSGATDRFRAWRLPHAVGGVKPISQSTCFAHNCFAQKIAFTTIYRPLLCFGAPLRSECRAMFAKL